MILGLVFKNICSEHKGYNDLLRKNSKMVEERDKLGKDLINQRGPGLYDFEKSTFPDGKRDKFKIFTVKIPCSREKAKSVAIPTFAQTS